MPKPITPLCGCDVFVLDGSRRLLLIRRDDTGLWALPGGCQDLRDTPAQAAIRECREETGLDVELTALLGVWSSLSYPYVNYPWKDNVFTHVLFAARVTGGTITPSPESPEVAWFAETEIPALSDGHEPRVTFGFRWASGVERAPYFE